MICRVVTIAPDAHYWEATDDDALLAKSRIYKSAVSAMRALRKFLKEAGYAVVEHYSKPREAP